MKTNQWSIIFCAECTEPTPPAAGMTTDHLGFICDDCLNNELSLSTTKKTSILNHR